MVITIWIFRLEIYLSIVHSSMFTGVARTLRAHRPRLMLAIFGGGGVGLNLYCSSYVQMQDKAQINVSFWKTIWESFEDVFPWKIFKAEKSDTSKALCRLSSIFYAEDSTD